MPVERTRRRGGAQGTGAGVATWRRRYPPLLAAGLLVALAGAAGYLGVAIALSLAAANRDAAALAGAAGYLGAAFVAPVLAAAYLRRTRRWGPARTLGLAAGLSLLVHALLLPVALAALAM